VNDAPNTAALAEQKENSLAPLESFWLQCLIEGRIVNQDFKNSWQVEISKIDFRLAFKAYAQERGIKSWLPSDSLISREIKKFSPSAVVHQKIKIDNAFVRAFRFEGLEICRAEWCKRMNMQRVWD
jgi:hypothetical protein